MNRRRFLRQSAASAAGAALAASLPAPLNALAAEKPVQPATGPLQVCQKNPRYFADASGKAVYLTGAHTWNNLQDMGPGESPPAFDFEQYLNFLQKHAHNFIRLWRWELTQWDAKATQQYTDQKAMYAIAPHPWKRTGPGLALDGLPKFDLKQFDPAYFQRLRQRGRAAGDRGIYVSIMLFEGWGVQHLKDAWKSHPFNAANNVNDLQGDLDGDGSGTEVHTLRVPAVTRLQEAYVRHVSDTVNDLDNALYEIVNESGGYSTEWQYHMIRFIKEYEKAKPKQHPVGMTFPYARDPKQRGTNAMLFDSPADWISPNPDAAGGYNYRTNPPPATGAKVILSDTDHLWGIGGNPDWAWKSFVRGHNPLFMDPYDNRVLGKVPAKDWEQVRQSLGHTRRLADRLDLAAMTPREELASTKFCLASPGQQYVVYLPKGGAVEVDLSAASGPLAVEWIDGLKGTSQAAKTVSGGSKQTLQAPFDGPAVLYLQKRP